MPNNKNQIPQNSAPENTQLSKATQAVKKFLEDYLQAGDLKLPITQFLKKQGPNPAISTSLAEYLEESLGHKSSRKKNRIQKIIKEIEAAEKTSKRIDHAQQKNEVLTKIIEIYTKYATEGEESNLTGNPKEMLAFSINHPNLYEVNLPLEQALLLTQEVPAANGVIDNEFTPALEYYSSFGEVCRNLITHAPQEKPSPLNLPSFENVKRQLENIASEDKEDLPELLEKFADNEEIRQKSIDLINEATKLNEKLQKVAENSPQAQQVLTTMLQNTNEVINNGEIPALIILLTVIKENEKFSLEKNPELVTLLYYFFDIDLGDELNIPEETMRLIEAWSEITEWLANSHFPLIQETRKSLLGVFSQRKKTLNEKLTQAQIDSETPLF